METFCKLRVVASCNESMGSVPCPFEKENPAGGFRFYVF